MEKSKKILLFGGLAFFILLVLFLSFNKKSRENLLAAIGFKKEPVYLTYSVNVFPEQDKIVPPFEMPEIKQPIFPENICNILDFGAVGDGKTMNTKAFSNAIASCVKKEGGKVVVPSGIWLTGPIKMQSNIHLEVQKDAEILFSVNFDDYLPVVFSRFEGIEYYNYSPPIYARDCTNIAITGEGKINGQGEKKWWKMSEPYTIQRLYAMGNENVPVENRIFGKPEYGLRPSFIQFVNCKNILIDGPTFLKGPMWTIHPIYSNSIIIKNVNIFTSPGKSTDGIVLDSSKNILVENATLDTGDDAIVIKSGRNKDGMRVNIPSENIVVRNSRVNEAHGSIVIGSEMSGGVRNVFAYNLTTDSSDFGVRIKAARGRGGFVENIWIQGLTMRSISNSAILFDLNYENSIAPSNGDLPVIKNIFIKNVACEKTRTAVLVDGLPDIPVENINFENFSINSRDGISFNNARSISLKNIAVTPKFEPPYKFNNVADLSSQGLNCPKKTKNCVLISGDNSKNIGLSGLGINAKNIIAPDRSDVYSIDSEKNK
jgi:polygalacturonase